MKSFESFNMPEQSPESNENKELSAEKIMEEARERRLGIAGRAFDRVADTLRVSPPAKRLISWLVNLTPISAPKMIAEGIRGETFGGEKLKPYDRIMHLGIQATNVMAWGLGVYKLSKGDTSYTEPMQFYATSWGLWFLYELPKIMKNAKDTITEKNPKAAEFFEKMMSSLKGPVSNGVGEPPPELAEFMQKSQ